MSMRPVYVPIVKGKTNDLMAVGLLQPTLRRLAKPLIEAMPLNPKRGTLDEHVHRLCMNIRKHVPLGSIFLDFYGLDPEANTADGQNATLFGYSLLKAFGRSVTPVYGLSRNDDLWVPLGDVARVFGEGFCFRLARDDLEGFVIEDTWGEVIERSAQLRVVPGETDLLLDFGSIAADEVENIVDATIDFLFHNPRVASYRSIIVASSSALKDVSEVGKDSSREVTREELRVWSRLWREMPDAVKPIFSDYGVVHPAFSDQGSVTNINAKIRYTSGHSIHYFRGHGLYRPVKDFHQYQTLAARVTTSGYFEGRGESFGDSFIEDCAKRRIGNGVPANWVKADMNRHLSCTTRQLQRTLAALARAESEEQADSVLAWI